VEIGPRDIAQNSVFVGRRDKGHREKESIPRDQFTKTIVPMLDEIQTNLFGRALRFREENSVRVGGNERCEEKIKADLSVTIRCIPANAEDAEKETGSCIACGGKSDRRMVFAKAY